AHLVAVVVHAGPAVAADPAARLVAADVAGVPVAAAGGVLGVDDPGGEGVGHGLERALVPPPEALEEELDGVVVDVPRVHRRVQVVLLAALAHHRAGPDVGRAGLRAHLDD